MLELDVRHLHLYLWKRHLVNAYDVKAGIGVIAGKLCDPCLSTLSVKYYKKSATVFFSFFSCCFLLFFLLIAFYHVTMKKDVYKLIILII